MGALVVLGGERENVEAGENDQHRNLNPLPHSTESGTKNCGSTVHTVKFGTGGNSRE